MEEEARTILRATVGGDSSSGEGAGLGTRIARRFGDDGLGEPIAELRGSPAHPASFDEKL